MQISAAAAKLRTAPRQRLMQAGQHILDQVYERAKDRSTGGVSSKQLRREDHPYARRHGRARRDSSIINRQSGRFIAAWSLRGVMPSADGATGTVENTAPYAEFLAGGTRFMFARPLTQSVERELRGWAEKQLRDALLGSMR